MKILLKRLFACCMAVCMVVTMCSVLFTVSAEDALADTVTVETVEYTRDPADLEPSVEVPVKVLAAKTGLKAVQVWLEVAEGLTATGVKLAATENLDKLTLTYADADDANVVLDSIEGYTSAVAPKVYENGQISVLVESDELIKTEFEIVITYTGEFTADSYTIAVADGTQAGYAKDQDLLDLTFVDGGITVVEGHVCTPGEVVIENQVNADCDTNGSYDEVVYCSVCGDELSREAKTTDALGHTEAEAVIENNVDATCTTAGSYDTVVYCTVCSEELSRVTTPVDALGHDYSYTDNGDGTHNATCANGCAGITNEAHTYTEGKCVCGAKEVTGPVVDTNLVFRDTSIAYGSSSLELSFRIRNTVLALYDNIEVVIIPQKYDTETLNIIANPTEIVTAKDDLAAAGSSNKTYVYKDAYLYELGLSIEYMMRAYDAEGNLVAVSETFTTSGAQIIKEIYAKQTANPKMQTLLTDTLIVGQEAINSMKIGLPDSDLAKAPSIIGDFDISAATQSYESYNTIDEFTSYNDDVSTDKSATHRVIKSVTIGKVPYPTYRVKDTAGVFDLDKFGFRVAYTQVDGAGTETEFDYTYTTANSNAISLVNGYVNFKYESIALQDSNQNITFEFTYDGAPLFTSVYSMETFLGANLTNANTGALMDALIKLGVSFRAYSAN